MPTPVVIDLSHHNTIPGTLKPAHAAGIIGLIHKATEGSSYQDNKVDAREYLAREANMMFGLYHFIRPDNISKQADNFMSVYKRYKRDDILIVLDYEDMDVSLDMCGEWLAGVEGRTGIIPVVYSGHVLKEKLGGKKHPVINGDTYPLWLAQYGLKAELPAGWDEYWLWQYTDKGTIAGVTPPTDLNTGDPVRIKEVWLGAPPVNNEAKYKAALESIRKIADDALG